MANNEDEEREELINRISNNYLKLKGRLKNGDIERIIDVLFQERIFTGDLNEEIRAEKTMQAKTTLILENIMKSSLAHIKIFLNILQCLMPDVYTSITGKESNF